MKSSLTELIKCGQTENPIHVRYTIGQITKLLSYEFILLVCIAIIIAVPVTWYAAANWLQRYAYRIQVSPIVFIITALFAIILTLLTVGIQAIRAASANPVDSLRTE
jgi:ABC-type antimicrobial peptide transport system permease subunit